MNVFIAFKGTHFWFLFVSYQTWGGDIVVMVNLILVVFQGMISFLNVAMFLLSVAEHFHLLY